MLKKYLKPLRKSQTGYASFVITLITMIVVSLIVVAFAFNSRKEQKDALANNLATQAYYAAESGIDDAYNVVSTLFANGKSATVLAYSSSNCQESLAGSPFFLNPGITSIGGPVNYDCIIINAQPPTLQYQPIYPGAAQSTVLDNVADSNAPISSITVSWQDDQPADSSATFTNCPAGGAKGDLPALTATSSPDLSSTGCDAGLLQLDLVSDSSITNAGSVTTPATYTIYLEPEYEASGNVTVVNSDSSPSNDQLYQADCGLNTNVNLKYCNVKIDLSSLSASADNLWYLHLLTFYKAEDVQVGGIDSSSNPLNLENSQILLDSTGKANGQSKRIQERVCYGSYCSNGTSGAALGAIQSTQCINKQFYAYPQASGSSTPPPTKPAQSVSTC